MIIEIIEIIYLLFNEGISTFMTVSEEMTELEFVKLFIVSHLMFLMQKYTKTILNQG